jgi:hypothetical protein
VAKPKGRFLADCNLPDWTGQHGTFSHTAGVEHGKLKHVPSTSDLLGVAMPPSIAAEARRAASDLSTALQVGPAAIPTCEVSEVAWRRMLLLSVVADSRTVYVLSSGHRYPQHVMQEYSPPGSPRSDSSDRGVGAHAWRPSRFGPLMKGPKQRRCQVACVVYAL